MEQIVHDFCRYSYSHASTLAFLLASTVVAIAVAVAAVVHAALAAAHSCY